MNKKLNAFLRILTVGAAIAAVVFAFLLKGKMDVALKNTAWATDHPEVKAGKDFDARMASLATLPALIDGKRKVIVELETAKKELQADVADKKTKIEGLSAQNTTLEAERTDLTRKNGEMTTQLTDANSKKDGAVAELATSKEELVKEKEKTAAMFSKEQLAEIEAKATKADEKASALLGKYVALHTKTAMAMENSAPFGFQRDPFGEAPAKIDGAPATVVVEATSETMVAKLVAVDSKSGIVALSVGESSGIKEKSLFEVRLEGKKVGKVQISFVKGSLSFAQIQPDSDVSAFNTGKIVSLVPSTKAISNQ